MKKYVNENGFVIYYSDDNDWNDKNNRTIVVWEGTILPKEQHTEFEEWINSEFDVDAKSVGSYTNSKGSLNFIFTIGKNINSFAIKRFALEGMRWFYDSANDVNGGISIDRKEINNFENLLNDLGLVFS